MIVLEYNLTRCKEDPRPWYCFAQSGPKGMDSWFKHMMAKKVPCAVVEETRGRETLRSLWIKYKYDPRIAGGRANEQRYYQPVLHKVPECLACLDA